MLGVSRGGRGAWPAVHGHGVAGRGVRYARGRQATGRRAGGRRTAYCPRGSRPAVGLAGPARRGARPARRRPGGPILVLERLEEGTPREDWVTDHATALARLHACTSGTDADAVAGNRPPDRAGRQRRRRLPPVRRDLGVPAPPGATANRHLRGRPQPGNALPHGQTAVPRQRLRTPASGVRFIDFEQASLGNGGLVESSPICASAPPPAGAPPPRRSPCSTRRRPPHRATWRAIATGTEAPQDLGDACAGWLLRGDASSSSAPCAGPPTTCQGRGPGLDVGHGHGPPAPRPRLGEVVSRTTGATGDLQGPRALAGAVRRTCSPGGPTCAAAPGPALAAVGPTPAATAPPERSVAARCGTRTCPPRLPEHPGRRVTRVPLRAGLR